MSDFLLQRAPRRAATAVTTMGLAAAVAAVLLSGCAPLLVTGAVLGTGLVATDRRTTGIQLEDEAIEFKAAARVRALATLGQVSTTSYNRLVLITGEVPDERERQRVGEAIAGVENVRGVVNELAIAPNSRLIGRTQDAWILTRVKASLVEAKDLQANAFKVVVDGAVVYLMGRVTSIEAARAGEVARAVPGVQKVVQVFEPLTEEDRGRMGPRATAGATAAAEAAAAAASAGSPPPR